MGWLALCCCLTGLGMGMLMYSALGILLTSMQIVIYLLGFWAAGELTSIELLLWIPTGLFSHQAAYLSAFLLRSALSSSDEQMGSVASDIDNSLDLMISLAERIEHRAPEVQTEAANLSRLLAEMRQVLLNQQRLEKLLAERKSAA